MIDTHCHLTFPQYANRVAAVLDDAARVGVRAAITVSTTSRDALAARALAESDSRIWCTAGVHPLHSDEPVDWTDLRRAGESPRCVAWGELGLDNHYADPPTSVQRGVLDEQLGRILDWARAGLAKPVVVHCREAFDDLLPVLSACGLPRDRFVFHCFTGTPADARKVLDFGAWISFTGVVTFQNAPEVAAAARLVPLDRMMAETDAPFLSPTPVRTMRPNVPANVVYVYRFLAELRRAEATDVVDRLVENATSFYGLELP